MQQDFFQELIKILKLLPISAQDELWQLLAQLRTSPQLYSQLLSENSAKSLAQKSDNLPELLYSLQIIDSFINEYQIKNQSTVNTYYAESIEKMGIIDQEQYPSVGEAY